MANQCPDSDKIEGVTGAILAGGTSSRMGSDKSLLPFDGIAIIEVIYHKLATLFREVIIVTNTPEAYAFIPCRKVPDILPGEGSIAGLHSALLHSTTPKVFVVACDMPMLSPVLLRHLCRIEGEWDAVVPMTEAGYPEPLHALYARSALNEIETALKRGNKSIRLLYDRIRTRKVSWEEIEGIKGAVDSFRNINTPQEYEKIRSNH